MKWMLSPIKKSKKTAVATTKKKPWNEVISCRSQNAKTATCTVIQITRGCSGTLPKCNEPPPNVGLSEMTEIVKWAFLTKNTIKLRFLDEEVKLMVPKPLKPIRQVIPTKQRKFQRKRCILHHK